MNIDRARILLMEAQSSISRGRGGHEIHLDAAATKIRFALEALERTPTNHAPTEDLLAGAIQVALSNSEMVARLGDMVDRLLREREEIHVEGPQDPKIFLEIRSLSEWRVLHLCLGTSSGLLSEYNREIAAKIRKRMPPFPGKNEL